MFPVGMTYLAVLAVIGKLNCSVGNQGYNPCEVSILSPEKQKVQERFACTPDYIKGTAWIF